MNRLEANESGLMEKTQYDGSDSGARPDEAISWGKIRAGAESVKVSFFFIIVSKRIDAHLEGKGLCRCDVSVPVGGGCDIWQGALGGAREGEEDRVG